VTQENAVVIQYRHFPLETLTWVTIDDLLLFFIPVGNSDNFEAAGIINLTHPAPIALEVPEGDLSFRLCPYRHWLWRST
jgi:hypothetical protein